MNGRSACKIGQPVNYLRHQELVSPSSRAELGVEAGHASLSWWARVQAGRKGAEHLGEVWAQALRLQNKYKRNCSNVGGNPFEMQ